MRKVTTLDMNQLRVKAAKSLTLASEKIDLAARYRELKGKVAISRYTMANIGRLRVEKAVQNRRLEMLAPRRFRVNVFRNKE